MREIIICLIQTLFFAVKINNFNQVAVQRIKRWDPFLIMLGCDHSWNDLCHVMNIIIILFYQKFII